MPAEQDGLMRVFWPLDIPRSDHSGIIVGWRNSGLDLFVVAILEDVDVSCDWNCVIGLKC